jgi:glycosyltransferase involved in cell wall biosynthesis
MKKIAILHDWFDEYGGAVYDVEQIALTLNAPIYTTYIKNVSLNSDLEVIPFKQDKYLNSFYSRLLQSVALQMLSRRSDFKKLNLEEYDVVISSGIMSRAYVPTKDQYMINYPRSPPRWLYDLYDFHMNALGPIKRRFARIYCKQFKKWDISVLNNIDLIVANSEVVQERIKRYWNRDSIVIYPPVETSKYRYIDDEGYYLSVGRLDPLKRIDLIIETFKKLKGYEVKIVGTGPEERRLKELAKGCGNIEFCGFVDEKEKIDLLGRCRGLIFTATNEDFGLVPVEALASGKPVITVNEGYLPYMIKEGVNGVIVESNVKSLVEGTEKCERMTWDSSKIIDSAIRFDINNFIEQWRSLIGTIP